MISVHYSKLWATPFFLAVREEVISLLVVDDSGDVLVAHSDVSLFHSCQHVVRLHLLGMENTI